MRKLQLYIDGAFCDAEDAQTYRSINPATGEEIAEVALASTRDAQRAIAAARTAFDTGPWRYAPASSRKELIEKLAAALKERHKEYALTEKADPGAPNHQK